MPFVKKQAEETKAVTEETDVSAVKAEETKAVTEKTDVSAVKAEVASKKASPKANHTIFVSAAKEDTVYDINVGVTRIPGKRDKDRQHLIFKVPDAMVEQFRRHAFVVGGRVVEVKGK